MLPVPKLDDPRVVFGDISHMPKWGDLPEEFRRGCFSHPWCRVAENWFFNGCKFDADGKLIVGSVKLHPKDGVDQDAALRAIKACLGSWAPKHEHKIAGVGFMFSEWFDREELKRA